jgi:hypothetical protein
LNRARHFGALIGFCCLTANAWGAHFGTGPVVPATVAATLRISDHAPLCSANAANCVETTGAMRSYPVVDGDRVTIDWTNQPQLLDGVVEIGHLYLPLGATTNSDASTPITLTLQIPNDHDHTQLIVEYAGTSHHVPIPPNSWHPVIVYNPSERVLYVRLDDAAASATAN